MIKKKGKCSACKGTQFQSLGRVKEEQNVAVTLKALVAMSVRIEAEECLPPPSAPAPGFLKNAATEQYSWIFLPLQ